MGWEKLGIIWDERKICSNYRVGVGWEKSRRRSHLTRVELYGMGEKFCEE